ncbi:MAG: hypothetical protein ACOVLK_02825, partial [Terrimicrobiaceae bacterium]
MAAFAGCLVAEIIQPKDGAKSPIVWEDFAWDRGIIIIRAETAKTGMRRVVPILPALAHWLEPYRAETGRVCSEYVPPSSGRKKGVPSETARLGALIGGWKPNALRHSWISYRAALCGMGQTAMEAGNSESEAKKSYNSAKGKDEAGGEEAAGIGVGLEIAGDVEGGGGGERGEHLGLGLGKGGGEGGEALAARGFADGLELFFVESRDEGGGQRIGGERNHRWEAARRLLELLEQGFLGGLGGIDEELVDLIFVG